MLKEYFSLTSSERNGLFVLFALVLFLLVFSKVRQLTYEPELVDLSALQDSVQRFLDSPRIADPPKTYPKYKPYKTTSSSLTHKPKKIYAPKVLVVVEINKATAKELTQIKGVGEFYAKNIVEERKRLGGFRSLDQLLTVYGMTEEKLEGMKKQMVIDTTLCQPKVLLNSADSFQLADTYVIEPYLASRIVKYRERLGGFYDSRQLLDIFCVDEALYTSIMQRLVLDTVALRLLDINNDSFNIVMKHPYINGYKNAKAIFRYLDYGAIRTWDEFCKIPYLNIDNKEGLRHYLKFCPMVPKAEPVDSMVTTAQQVI